MQKSVEIQFFNTRNKVKSVNYVEIIFFCCFSDDISDIYVCDNRTDYSVDEANIIKNIILLEDILFYLDDMNELPFEYGNDIFDKFSLRVLKILKGNN